MSVQTYFCNLIWVKNYDILQIVLTLITSIREQLSFNNLQDSAIKAHKNLSMTSVWTSGFI